MGFRLPLLVLVLVLASCQGQTPKSSAAPAGVYALPDVALLTLDQKRVSLPVLLRGRPALVNLWATWCDACEREFDALNRLNQRVASRAFVLGVAVGEPHEKIESFARERGINYPLVVDESFAFADAIGSQRLPTTLVIGKDGRVLLRSGELDAATLEAFSRAIQAY